MLGRIFKTFFHLMMFCHGGPHDQEFVVPMPVRNLPWRTFIETAAKEPNDVYPALDGPPPPPTSRVVLPGHAMVCYVTPDWS